MDYIKNVIGASFDEAKELMARLGLVFNADRGWYENEKCRVALITYVSMPLSNEIDAAAIKDGNGQGYVLKRGNMFNYFHEQNAQERTLEEREQTKRTIDRQ